MNFKRLAAGAAWNIVTFIAVFAIGYILIQALRWGFS